MKIKRILSLLLCLAALLACGAAMAEPLFVDMPADSINPILPTGLKLLTDDPLLKDGQFCLNIDDETTDWTAVVASGYGTMAQIICQFAVPNDIEVGDAVIWFTDDPECPPEEILTDSENFGNHKVIDAIQTDKNGFRTANFLIDPLNPSRTMPVENSFTIGEHLPDSGYLNPYSADTALYLRWYEKQADGTYSPSTPCYRLKVDITHTQNQAFPMTAAAPVPKGSIATKIVENTEVNFSRNAVTSDGEVLYIMGIGDQAVTTITMPDGAKRYAIGSLKGGYEGSSDTGTMEISYTLSADMPVHADPKTIFFFNNDGALLATQTITLRYQTNQALAWPNYVNGFNKLTVGAEDSINNRIIIRNGAAEAGYEVSYANDSAHMISSFSGDVRNNSALTGTVEVTITPPAGAKSFRSVDFGSNGNILGPLLAKDEVSKFDEILKSKWNGTVCLVEEGGYLPSYSYNALRKITPADLDNLAIYVPSVPDLPNYANFLAVIWYSDTAGTQLLQRDFMWETIDSHVEPQYVPMLDSEDEIKEPVKLPCIVSKESQKAWRGNWKLLVKTYYQEGINARHYEFHLVDKDGNPVLLPEGETMTVYLPFPEEMEGAEPYETAFGLRHYSAQFYSKEDADLEGVPLTVEMTEYGLKLETDSFSPFILTWDGGETAALPEGSNPTLPQTGDATPLVLLGALCVLSVLTAVAIKRRKHA